MSVGQDEPARLDGRWLILLRLLESIHFRAERAR